MPTDREKLIKNKANKQANSGGKQTPTTPTIQPTVTPTNPVATPEQAPESPPQEVDEPAAEKQKPPITSSSTQETPPTLPATEQQPSSSVEVEKAMQKQDMKEEIAAKKNSVSSDVKINIINPKQAVIDHRLSVVSVSSTGSSIIANKNTQKAANNQQLNNTTKFVYDLVLYIFISSHKKD